MKEIELKFPLLNAAEVIAQLGKGGTREKQKDTYYAPPHMDFLSEKPVSRWLRIRESEGRTTLNFKHWHSTTEKESIVCDEFETGVEESAKLTKIFSLLGFRELVIVEKMREEWRYQDALVAIDDVKGLGQFIEIEYKGSLRNAEQIKKHLFSVLKELHAVVGKQDFEGYPHLLLKKKGLLPTN